MKLATVKNSLLISDINDNKENIFFSWKSSSENAFDFLFTFQPPDPYFGNILVTISISISIPNSHKEVKITLWQDRKD